MYNSRALVWFVVLLINCSASLEAQTIVRLCEAPFPPYVTGKEGHAPTGGIAVRIVEAIFSKIDGVTVEMVLLPLARCLKYVETGNQDGLILSIKTKGRPYLVYPDPLFPTRGRLYYMKANFPNGFEWKTFQDLNPYRIGTVAGASFGPAFDDASKQKKINIQFSDNADLVFQKLFAQRIDLAVAHHTVAKQLIKEAGMAGKIGVGGKDFNQVPYYTPLSQRSPAVRFIPRINQGIAELKAEGGIQRILLSEGS